MKTMFTSMFLIALMVLFMLPSQSFAEVPDSVIVAALPPGNLNNVILNDAAAGVTNRVYVLQQTGTVDTVYYLTATIQMRPSLTIVGKTNPNTGFPPVIAPSILSDNSSPSTYFNPMGGDTVKIKNVYLIGTRPDGSSVTGICCGAGGDTVTYIANHCVFENFGGGGTPNIINTWNSQHIKIFLTNCEFRNNQDDVPQNPGIAWVDPGTFPLDTAVFVNNTFFVFGGTVIGSAGYCGYIRFEHNTVFLTTKGGAFTIEQLTNADIKNNIFFGVNSAGLDSAHVNEVAVRNANFYTAPAVIELDTLTTTKIDPINATEASRTITVTNNAYFWPQAIVNNWATLNANGAGTTYGQIVPTIWEAATDPAILTDRTRWPGINISNNDSTDPGFNATLVANAADSMVHFVNTCWAVGTGLNDRPFVYLSDPTNMFANVPSNWATTQGYPVQENLRYSNTNLQHAGTDGKALGDLNWFPEQGGTGVSPLPKSMPLKFGLSQNYPNPFNPSTQISYTLAAKGLARLSVYDVLGREVAVLVNEVQNAGIHDVTFNAKNLSSGIYFYKLVSSGTMNTMKMLLLK
jgi:hypothetical protein